PLAAASPISPATRAIEPNTVVTLRKIRPCSSCGLVCRSAAAITAHAAPRTRPTALAAHAVENSTRLVPDLNATNPMIIATTMADDARSRQVNPTGQHLPHHGSGHQGQYCAQNGTTGSQAPPARLRQVYR